MINALEAYALLRQIGARPAEFQTRESGVEVESQPIQHAIDSERRPLLLVPLGQGESDISDLKSRGISLTSHIVPRQEAQVRTLTVRCLDLRLERQFFLLVDDMVRALSLGTAAPGLTCLQVLSRWRELFEPNLLGLLSSSAQVGLLAELHVLEVLVKSDPAASLEAWAGPLGGRHDFVTSKSSVEVKATTRRDSLSVKIHGIGQLDDHGSGSLWVYVEQMESSPAGESLPDVIDRIAESISDKATLFQNLGRVGYRLEDAEGYQGSRFIRVRTKLCRITDDFPRIVASSLKRPGLLDQIERLEYTIDLGPVPTSVSDDEALAATGRLLS